MDQKLNDHIKKARESGKSDEQIRSDLLWAGWNEEEVDDLLKGETQNLISKNFHFYSIKSIAILELLFGLYNLYNGLYYFYIILPSKRAESLLELPAPEQNLYFFAWLATGLILTVLGCLALAGSIQLFRFKKWGLYFTYIALVLVFPINLMMVGWGNIFFLYLAIAVTIFIYLIRQQRFILNFSNTVQTKKDIIKLLMVSGILLAIISAILVLGPIYYRESLSQQKVVQNEVPSPAAQEKIGLSKEERPASVEGVKNWKTRLINFGPSYKVMEIQYPSNYQISDKVFTVFGPALISEYAIITFDNVSDLPLITNGNQIMIGDILALELPLSGNRDGGIDYEIRFNDFPEPGKVMRILFSTKKQGFESKISEFKEILSTFKIAR